ncbi:MAG: hypothetical protein H6575_03270 [Lewinellaceae bacterium]|nr:hypothetical protein [Lewinellaceae bacterium]
MRPIAHLWLLLAILHLPRAGNGQFVQSRAYYYTPNSIHTPYLEQRFDGQFGIGYSWGGKDKALEIQTLFSPLKRIAFFANYQQTGNGSVKKSEVPDTRLRFGEAGLGYYHHSGKGVTSVLAGLGFGSVYNNYGNGQRSDLRMRRWSVQPGYVYDDQKGFRFGAALRLSNLQFPKGEAVIDGLFGEVEIVRRIEEDQPFFLAELGLAPSALVGPFVFKLQLTFTLISLDDIRFARQAFNIALAYDLCNARRGRDAAKERQGSR